MEALTNCANSSKTGVSISRSVSKELKPRGVESDEGDLIGDGVVGMSLQYPKVSGSSSAGHSIEIAGGVI